MMKVNIITKKSFSVIGKLGQGLASDSINWIQALWEDANNSFNEIGNLAKIDNKGNISGIWGIMSDVDENFVPWQEEGKYLAGCEVEYNAKAPKGWTKWIVPSYKYAVIKCTQNTYANTFNYMMEEYLPKEEYSLVGAIHEFYDPKDSNGELSLYFPIEKL